MREVCVWSLFCCVGCSVLSSCAINPLGMNALVAVLLLVFLLSRGISFLCLFHAVPRVGVKCIIVAFPSRTELLFNIFAYSDRAILSTRVAHAIMFQACG